MAARRALALDPVRRDRADGIDLLRGIFALWVVLAHLVPWTRMAQGADAAPAGVAAGLGWLIDLFQPHGELHPAVLGFIVLSGYCIHRAGLRRPGAGELAGYALRRAFRILPVFYLGLAGGVIGFAIASRHSPAGAAALSGTSQITAGCLAAKGLVLSTLSPQLYDCGFLGNGPLATVMVEIVLYAVYAAAFTGLVWRGAERVIWIGCTLLFFVSLVMFSRPIDPKIYEWWQNGSVFGFLPYWWLGVLFVDPRFARRVQRKLWLILAVWIALSWLLRWRALPAPLAVAELRKLAFALATGALIAWIDNAKIRLHRIAALTAVGRAGYGLYAVHAPLTYTLILYGCPWWAILGADIAVGLVIHRLIERPAIDLGRAVRLRLTAVPAGRRSPS